MGPRAIRHLLRWQFAVGALLAGVALLALPACDSWGRSSTAGTTETPTISAVRHPTLQDIPVPSGFMLVDDHSVSRSSGSLRVVRYEYIGNLQRAPLNRFYKEYMAGGGWTLTQERFDRGIYDMRFESDTEECLIRLRPEGNQTVIVVDLGPLPRGSAEREAKPPIPRP